MSQTTMQANYSITGAHAGDDQHPYTRNVPVGATIAETFENLLSSLKVQTYPLVSLYGSEEDARISPVKVDRHFHYDKFAGRIYGATNKEPMSPTQLSFDSMSSALSLNFYVTDMSENDLVYQIFGRDVTIKSCAKATWGGYKCIPTKFNIPMLNGAPPFRYLTVSKNNATATTFDLLDPASTPEQQASLMIGYLFSAEDNESIAFVDSTSFGVQPTPNPDGLAQLPVTGLSGKDVSLAGVTYDLLQTGLRIAGQHYPVTVITPEITTITIYPTPDVPSAYDAYPAMGGTGGEPIVISSCAKAAVVPFVCMPQSATMLFHPNFDTHPTGTVHGRYRVNNGAWVNYSAVVTEGITGLIADFFNSIKLDGKGIIETSGEGSFEGAIATPFRSYRGREDLCGASNKPPFNNYEWAVVEPKVTIIEFKVTQNNINDLVYLAFGKDVTVKSCADVIWEGL